ncbi:hypothetical protein BGW36DRAFT_428235 [Talaromyces proteolyticus]|uniref:AB hydrolase-1 domain-containing protein n=1 Tax=Talaromyces proteolyticus TaxID=1131652 RepID=A0AAD4PV71_9EURO|nr:uncharacterized protein BGW36DRAFT_428235 [Talaromyces proteolyticus]KAH8696215.1 hypothetical protein BGW36DRAFT_428235 [Talaromyces proteolyticus]
MALGESCRNKTGKLFFRLDTTSAAHDLEAVRVALGENHLNWLGLSYGTMLGAAYAELYLENVGVMVLDGNVDHSLSETSALHDAQPGVSNSGLSTLAQTLKETIAGNATGLSSTLATSETDSAFPGIAIGCLDWYHNATTLADVIYKGQLANHLAPYIKGASQTYRYQTACIGWPAPVKNPNHALNQKAMAKAPPVVMVNSYYYPEASYVWAEDLRNQIPSTILLTRNGSGHTSYSLREKPRH